jgi:predicted glycosyltransferase
MINHQPAKTILIYCQHLLGIGHLMRAAALARSLSRHRVHLVLGGRVMGKMLASTPFNIYRLPALGCDHAVTHLIPLEPGQSLETVQNKRRKKLLTLLDTIAPHLAVVEMFPFGRPWFRFELVPILEALHRQGVPVVCSVRDVLVQKKDPLAYARQVLEDLHRYFRAVLVHSDPVLIRLEETFPAADRIPVPLYYTGYVDGARYEWHSCPGHDKKHGQDARAIENREPASQGVSRRGLVAWPGSGVLGGPVVEAILEASAQGLLPDLKPVRIYAGHCLDQSARTRLDQMARNTRGIMLKTFTRKLRNHLGRARAAVCMAGYMSAVDIMATHIPAVMIPIEHGGEQMFRARKLQEAGYARVLPLAALNPHSLAHKVEEALQPREEPAKVSLDGAPRSAGIIEAIMAGRLIPPFKMPGITFPPIRDREELS